MHKEENRQTFRRKEKQMINKRIFAFKLLQKENLISNIVNERDFLEEIEKKSLMNQEQKAAFNKKYATLYNKLQQEYKKCLQSKRDKRSAIYKKENNSKHNQIMKELY